MNKELKAKWVEALRSGKYKQTKRRLQSVNGKAYCCLGVLEHCVMGVEYGPEYRAHKAPDNLPDAVKNPASTTLDTAGMDGSIPGGTWLWYMNDIEEKTFAEIADVIEARL